MNYVTDISMYTFFTFSRANFQFLCIFWGFGQSRTHRGLKGISLYFRINDKSVQLYLIISKNIINSWFTGATCQGMVNFQTNNPFSFFCLECSDAKLDSLNANVGLDQWFLQLFLYTKIALATETSDTVLYLGDSMCFFSCIFVSVFCSNAGYLRLWIVLYAFFI